MLNITWYLNASRIFRDSSSPLEDCGMVVTCGCEVVKLVPSAATERPPMPLLPDVELLP